MGWYQWLNIILYACLISSLYGWSLIYWDTIWLFICNNTISQYNMGWWSWDEMTIWCNIYVNGMIMCFNNGVITWGDYPLITRFFFLGWSWENTGRFMEISSGNDSDKKTLNMAQSKVRKLVIFKHILTYFNHCFLSTFTISGSQLNHVEPGGWVKLGEWLMDGDLNPCWNSIFDDLYPPVIKRGKWTSEDIWRSPVDRGFSHGFSHRSLDLFQILQCHVWLPEGKLP